MINKNLGYLIGLVVFLISLFASYSFFSRGGGAADNFNLAALKYQPPKSTAESSTDAISNEPKTEECPINGELLTKTQKDKWDKRRPLGVMIENHKDARPESGFSSSDVIYEAVAEGGITRMLTIFYCKDTPLMGPIRSARIYFLKILQGYGDHPLYAHVGGANAPGPADALGEIADLGWANYNDLNQFAVPFPYYWRDYERLAGRATEHTVYSTTAKLWEYAKSKRNLTNVDKKDKKWDATFKPWKFMDDVKADERGVDGGKVSFGFWNQFAADYSVVWTYDKMSNSYKRENGGEAHIDKNTNKQLTTKNVIIVFSNESPVKDEYGGHLFYKIIGTGDALIFQNGKSVKGTWRKKDEESQMRFYDEVGKETSVVRGQAWVEILPTGNKVTY